MKTHEIIVGLYTRGATWKLSYAQKMAGMEELNYPIVVNLTRKVDYTLRDVTHYVHFPMSDGRLDKVVDDVEALADALAVEILHNDRNVLVHCNAGRNRSGLLAALIVSKVETMTYKEALEHVRWARPRAVANPHFERYLVKGEL